MKKTTKRNLKLETQTVRQLDHDALTDARGGSNGSIGCNYGIQSILLPTTHVAR